MKFRNADFCEQRKSRIPVPTEKPLQQDESQQLTQLTHIWSQGGIKPRTHWWRTSALAAVSSILPLYICMWQNTTCCKKWRICIQSQTFSDHVISQASCKQCNGKVQQPGKNIKYPFLKVNKSQCHHKTQHMAIDNPIYCTKDYLTDLQMQNLFSS